MDPDTEATDLPLAHTALVDLLASLPHGAWALASPCEGWDVAAVVRHLVVGERAFTTSLGGSAYDLPTLVAEVAAVGDDELAGAYATGATALRDALGVALAGDADARFPTGLGPMPAVAVARLRTIEALAHGWDVAHTVGRSLEIPDEVAERAVRHSRELMARLPPGRTPFAPEQPVAPGAPALDRLMALLGRRPG